MEDLTCDLCNVLTCDSHVLSWVVVCGLFPLACDLLSACGGLLSSSTGEGPVLSGEPLVDCHPVSFRGVTWECSTARGHEVLMAHGTGS